jgi:hypothetical protein
MFAIEVRRRELRWPQWQVDDAAGTADRSYPKLLFSETRSGRQGEWQTVSDICAALFPTGYRVWIEPAEGTFETDDELRHALATISKYDFASQSYQPADAEQSRAAAAA